MKSSLFAACGVPLLLVLAQAFADSPPPRENTSPSDVSFLEPGKDYMIRFAEGSDFFKITESGVSQSTYTTEEGKTKQGDPVTWTSTITMLHYQVVRPGGGSWVLLRHAAKPSDFAAWDGQRRAIAILASPQREELEAKPDGKERLERLQQAAEKKIETSETWVNLNHAVTISDVPTRSPSQLSADS